MFDGNGTIFIIIGLFVQKHRCLAHVNLALFMVYVAIISHICMTKTRLTWRCDSLRNDTPNGLPLVRYCFESKHGLF
jgi:hypothetical protein